MPNPETLTIMPEPDIPFSEGTVLEMVGVHVDPIQVDQQGPPPTPPVPLQTHTRSGEGFAQVNDDEDNEYLYE